MGAVWNYQVATMTQNQSNSLSGYVILWNLYIFMHPGLFMMNTIMLREHNRVCDILEEHPEWEDEQLYQTAKNIIAGGSL